MERMATHYEKEFKVNNKVKSAMVYPAVLSVVATLVVVFLLTFVMPTFLSMFEGSGVPLPAPTRLLLAISNSFRNFWYVYALVILGAVYLFKRYTSTTEGRRVVDRYKLRLPLYKGLTRKVISARFCRTLSTLLASGIPLLQAMENVAGAVGNTVVAESIIESKEDVRKRRRPSPSQSVKQDIFRRWSII